MRIVSTVRLILWTILWCELGMLGYPMIRSRIRPRATHIIKTAKESVTATSSGGLAYFFEPIANLPGQNSQPPWLTTQPVYTINADTLHDSKNYQHDKPDGTYRIITLGDSFTYGLFVNTKDNWTEALEDRLNAIKPCQTYTSYDVINLGMTGYDLAYAVERLHVRGVAYHPDLVLWFIKQDDFDQISEYTLPKAAEYMKAKQLENIHYDVHIGEEVTSALLKAYGKEKITAYQRKALSGIRGVYTGKLLLYSMPDVFKAHYIDNEKIIADFLSNDSNAALYVSHINLSNVGAIFPDHHPNQQGHRIIADDIYSHIIQSRSISCTRTDR